MSKKYLITTLFLSLALWGCKGSLEITSSSQSTSSEGQDHSGNVQVVEVVINENSYPLSFVDEEGKYTGYDGELLLIINQRLPEYSFHFNAVSRDAMLIGLSTNTYNLAANHFYINKRAR